MAGKETRSTKAGDTRSIGFHPLSLAIFSIGLVLAGGLVGSGMLFARPTGRSAHAHLPLAVERNPGAALAEVPPWGELETEDIWVERPAEYIAAAVQYTNRPAQWVFDKLSPDQVRNLMLSCGLKPVDVGRLLSPERISITPQGTSVRPDDDFVLSLTPKARAALYHEQPHNGANPYISTPFVFQNAHVDDWLAGSELEPAVVAQFKKLVYLTGQFQCFSDAEVLMRWLPSDTQRLALMKAISRQPAVLVSLLIRPNTDVDKVLGYWNRGTQNKDARPLLESLTRRPEGGSVSLLFFLPPFARDRVFTFPKTSVNNAPLADCHWSAFNFFSESPDNQFLNESYTLHYLATNYYPISKPTLYGDIVLVIKRDGTVLHSAVYIADDIVFTKNGNNVQQPWTLMRMKDLLPIYDRDNSVKFAFARQNER